MGYVVTLERFTPAARLDEQPWTGARVEEAAARSGPFTELETFDLDPVDADPADPAARSFTTEAATLVAGWYRVVWIDADGNTQPTDAVYNASWRPTVQDVADLCPAYTRAPVDGEGESAGAQRRAFDDATNPTAGTVEGLIDAALQEVASRVGVDIPARNVDLARRTAAWHAAAAVEAERMPEGVDDANSAHRWKQASYLGCLTELTKQARMGAIRLA